MLGFFWGVENTQTQFRDCIRLRPTFVKCCGRGRLQFSMTSDTYFQQGRKKNYYIVHDNPKVTLVPLHFSIFFFFAMRLSFRPEIGHSDAHKGCNGTKASQFCATLGRQMTYSTFLLFLTLFLVPYSDVKTDELPESQINPAL